MKPRVHIVVLGDVGRSPRMQYHAGSFVQEGWRVQLSGYFGSRPHHSVSRNADIELTYLAEPPKWINKLRPRLIMYPIKMVFMLLSLLWHLLRSEWAPVVLVQNPPAVPTFLAVSLICWLRGSQIMVDWHNYGYSIMALTAGENSLQTKLYQLLECSFARRFLHSAQHVCVSQGLKADLYTKWGLVAKTLHDKPSPGFKRATLGETHKLFTKLSLDYPEFTEASSGIQASRSSGASQDSSLNGDVHDSTGVWNVSRRPDGPAILVSSSSWTPDDSVDLLLEALDIYDAAIKEDTSLPRLLCVLTGRGPTKAHYESVIRAKDWDQVDVVLPWLEPEDYPLMLGSADLGICMHNSTSGLDLPMKVVDMFGAELPVCSLDYPVLHELVMDKENGELFTTGPQLAAQLTSLLRPLKAGAEKYGNWLPTDCQLACYRTHIAAWRADNWHRNWRRVVLPRMQSLIR